MNTPPAGAGRGEQAALLDRLVRFWRDELSRDDLDADSNLWMSGGTSLHVLHLRTRVQSEFGLDLSARTIYRNPTPRLLESVLLSEMRTR